MFLARVFFIYSPDPVRSDEYNRRIGKGRRREISRDCILQPPFLGPAAPGPEVGGAFPLRAKVFAVPIVALAFRSSIFLRSISSYVMLVG
jgi:hypothetical protein